MKRSRIKTFTCLVLIYFSTSITHGNASFGDYLKRKYSNVNHTLDTKITDITRNGVSQTDFKHQEAKNIPRRENFNVQEVRLYKNNPTPMFPDREKNMLESLLSGKTLPSGQAFDLRKQIYGAQLKKEFDTLLEHTSPSWDRLEELLKKAEKITRLPQSMYYDEEDNKLDPEFKDLHTDTTTVSTTDEKNAKRDDLNVAKLLKQKLQQIRPDNKIPNSFYDLSMNFDKGQQIYPFEPDLSFSGGIFRNKREINLCKNVSKFTPSRRPVNDQILREAEELYFSGSPLNYQFPETNEFTHNLTTLHLQKVMEKNPHNFRRPSLLNLKNKNSTRIYLKITSKITKPTPHGTLDSTWKELVKQLNPIQQKIIEDLFLYGPPTTTQISPLNTTENRKQINNSLFFKTSLSPQHSASFSAINLRIQELGKSSKPEIGNTSENVSSYPQSQPTEITTSPTPHKSTVTIDENLMKEWLKSLNPQDQKEIENLFFNGLSSPLYDINDIESIKKAIQNEYLREPGNEGGQFATNNPKSTFISKNDRRGYTEDIGQYNYEDLSRLLRQAPQDKLKIVNDWCDEIDRDLHRRFPTATMKPGETREPRPLYPTRYYPWELFSMLPNQN